MNANSSLNWPENIYWKFQGDCSKTVGEDKFWKISFLALMMFSIYFYLRKQTLAIAVASGSYSVTLTFKKSLWFYGFTVFEQLAS